MDTHAIRDRQLIKQICSGDERAFAEAFDIYAESLYRFAYLYLHERFAAEDAVQDVFVQLWERREQLEIYSNLRNYLYRAVRNRVLNVVRHERSHERVAKSVMTSLAIENHHTMNDGERALEQADLLAAIRHTLSTLPARTRQVFLLRREEGMSYEEISNILGIGIPSIRNQVSRATQALLAAVKKIP